MSLSTMIFLLFAISVAAGIAKAISDAKLLKENPQGWAALKQHEADEKERKLRARQAGVQTGLGIFTTIFKK